MLGIGRGTAYEAVRAGDIPSIRLGKRLVVPRRALVRILEGEKLDEGTHHEARKKVVGRRH
jgi:excisionase family DNA binding protein